jgi:large subunit ribosomal protein L15
MSLALHNLKSTGPRRKRHRVGRGNGNNWGRTCGRGDKGQLARSGASHRPFFEGGQIPLIRRLPKRGFHNCTRKHIDVVNVDDLERRFESGAEVTPAALRERGLIGKRCDGAKVLGRGELSKAVTVRDLAVSAGARTKIEAAGGSVQAAQAAGETDATTGDDGNDDPGETAAQN